jgi:hypothetical protein
MRKNYPNELNSILRASKYYPEQGIWWFTFPTSYFDKKESGHIDILLQFEKEPDQFHYLKVPFDFLRNNQTKFDIRSSGGKFDLRISAKQGNWLIDERSEGVGFNEFEQKLF